MTPSTNLETVKVKLNNRRTVYPQFYEMRVLKEKIVFLFDNITD